MRPIIHAYPLDQAVSRLKREIATARPEWGRWSHALISRGGNGTFLQIWHARFQGTDHRVRVQVERRFPYTTPMVLGYPMNVSAEKVIQDVEVYWESFQLACLEASLVIHEDHGDEPDTTP